MIVVVKEDSDESEDDSEEGEEEEEEGSDDDDRNLAIAFKSYNFRKNFLFTKIEGCKAEIFKLILWGVIVCTD